MNGVEVRRRESYEFGEESSFIVTFVRQLRNSRLQGTVGSSREFRHLMTKEVYEGVID